MKFKATTTTEDGRLTEGKVYQGQIVSMKITKRQPFSGRPLLVNGFRIVVFDNTGKWMTFNPSVFVPYVEEVK